MVAATSQVKKSRKKIAGLFTTWPLAGRWKMLPNRMSNAFCDAGGIGRVDVDKGQKDQDIGQHSSRQHWDRVDGAANPAGLGLGLCRSRLGSGAG